MLVLSTFLLMLIVAYTFYQEGLFIAFCSLANLFIAFVMVASFYEPTASFFDIHFKDGVFYGFEDAIAMMGIFLPVYFGLKIMAGHFSPSVVVYTHLVHNLGGAFIGLFVGYLANGFLWCVLQTLPWQENFMGFEVRSSKKTPSPTFLRPDRVWLSAMRKLSKNAFKTEQIFDPSASFELRYQRYRRFPEGKNPQVFLDDIDFNNIESP